MAPPPRTIPILMYHKVGQPQDTFLNVSARDFRRQIRLMHRLGYQARTFVQIVQSLQQGTPLPTRTFAITFDDGYGCVGEYAAPILAEFGFPATVFVVSEAVGKSNAWDKANGKPVLPLMSWEALRRLQRAGWEVAGHTRSHPHLDRLDLEQAAEEIRQGKEETEAQLGTVLRTFCYPYGDYNRETPSLVRGAGFSAACTTHSGLARQGSDPFLLPRVKVAYRDGAAGLLYRLLLRPHLPSPRRK